MLNICLLASLYYTEMVMGAQAFKDAKNFMKQVRWLHMWSRKHRHGSISEV